MLKLLLYVWGRADEIWVRSPVELCELCVKWFAVWVSKRTKPVSHCLPSVSLKMIVCAFTCWARHVCRVFVHVLCVCVREWVCICMCFYVHNQYTCLFDVYVHCCWMEDVPFSCNDEPGGLAWQTDRQKWCDENCLWPPFVTHPPPSLYDRPW